MVCGCTFITFRRNQKMSQTVTKDMQIGQLLSLDQNIAAVLMRAGMHCIGCPASQGESLEEAAYVHGIDPDLLLVRLNAFLDSKQQ
jgi:hybrid cluster-associated redox disulfide protein